MARITTSLSRKLRQPLQRRLGVLAMENVSGRNNAAARRLLELLSDENLETLAAKAPGIDKITLECGVAGQAWEDTRVRNRINQLSRQGVDVERETVSTQFGGMDLERERLVVRF